MTIWVCKESYLRFSAEDYNAKETSNIFSHLTNNSIAKNSSQFTNSPIRENMWSYQDFLNYLDKAYDSKGLDKLIKDQIKRIVYATFMTAQDKIMHRNGSHEIFGIDLMVDSSFNVWLIEVNSSPCMDYSTVIK
jgi:tubulin monoglycylase TTLL3/8